MKKSTTSKAGKTSRTSKTSKVSKTSKASKTSKKNLLIHVGAHKTATTYLQNTLKRNKDNLLERKLLYIPLEDMRNGITAVINDDSVTAEETFEKIISYADISDIDNILLSDENILGSFGDIFWNQKIAPNIQNRVKKLRLAFKDYNIRIFLTIRSYDAYYASIYCEFLRHFKKFISFQKFMGDFDYLRFNWSIIVRDLLLEIEPDDLCVFRFEDFIEHEEQVFKALTNGVIPGDYDRHDRDNSRSSFQHTTIGMLEELKDSYDRHLLKKVLGPIDLKVRNSNYSGKFKPFDESQTKYLQERYARDVAKIKRLGVAHINFHTQNT